LIRKSDKTAAATIVRTTTSVVRSFCFNRFVARAPEAPDNHKKLNETDSEPAKIPVVGAPGRPPGGLNTGPSDRLSGAPRHGVAAIH
jgi:hypothetical protein